jgi:septum formation topological specificity factor MinE
MVLIEVVQGYVGMDEDNVFVELEDQSDVKN